MRNLFKVHLLNNKTTKFHYFAVCKCLFYFLWKDWVEIFTIYIYGNYIFTIHDSVLSISCYYTVVEVILRIDATISLTSFPLCLTDDPLVLSKTVRKGILTIPFSEYIQGWFCRWRLITNDIIQTLILLLIKYYSFTSEQISSSFKKSVQNIECHLLI